MSFKQVLRIVLIWILSCQLTLCKPSPTSSPAPTPVTSSQKSQDLSQNLPEEEIANIIFIKNPSKGLNLSDVSNEQIYAILGSIVAFGGIVGVMYKSSHKSPEVPLQKIGDSSLPIRKYGTQPQIQPPKTSISEIPGTSQIQVGFPHQGFFVADNFTPQHLNLIPATGKTTVFITSDIKSATTSIDSNKYDVTTETKKISDLPDDTKAIFTSKFGTAAGEYHLVKVSLKEKYRVLELPKAPDLRVNNVIEFNIPRKPSTFSKGGERYSNIEDRSTLHISQQTGTTYHAVYDGHGGSANVSDHLQQNFHTFLDKNYSKWMDDPSQLKQLFVEFDNTYSKNITQNVQKYAKNPGSTAVIMIDRPGKDLLIVNLGDSPAVVVKKDGTVLRTTDHDPSKASEQKRIKDLGGTVINNRYLADGISHDDYRIQGLAVSRVFGDAHTKEFTSAEPDVYSIPRKDVSFVMLMSDGVGEALSDIKPGHPKDSVQGMAQEVNDLLAKNPNADVSNLYYNNLTNKGTDDITISIIPVAP